MGRTDALEDHVHRHGQVDELNGLAEGLGERRDGREVDIRREGTTNLINARRQTKLTATHLNIPATDDMTTMAHFSLCV